MTAALLIVGGGISPARAQSIADYDYENLSFRGIGVDYGRIWPSRVAATPAYSVRIDLGFLGPGVRIVPTFTYWSSHFRPAELNRLAAQINNLPALREQGAAISGENLGEIKWSDLMVGVDAHLLWTTPIGVFTYVGAGAAVHALNGQGTFVEDTFVEDLLDSTAAGVAVMGGAEAQIFTRLRVYGEARFTLVSDIRYAGLRIGGTLMLPQRTTAPTTR